MSTSWHLQIATGKQVIHEWSSMNRGRGEAYPPRERLQQTFPGCTLETDALLLFVFYVMYHIVCSVCLGVSSFYSQLLTRSHVLGHMMLMLAAIAPPRSLVMTREASSIE